MSRKVLIIDDDGQDHKSMAIVLRKAGYEHLAFAETGPDGIRLAQTFKPDVILIDVVLRQVDGFDVCMEMRKAGVTARIIMITGHLDAVNAKKAVVSGADEIVEKKAGFPKLPAVIEQVCGP